MAQIDVSNLTFCYRLHEPVLKDLTFSVGQGEMVAITGESGSGKSTLFYLLGLLATQYQGVIRFDGRPLQELRPEEQAQLRNQALGFIFQQFFLLPRANVLDNILLPAFYPFAHSKPTPTDHSRAIQLAERLGIAELLDRKPQELSGGQQQRVAIARALMRDPKLILADEPTGNLDSQTTQMVMAILKDLNLQGRTIIIITHSPEVAALCSRVIRLRDGQIVSDSKNSTPPLASSPSSPTDWHPLAQKSATVLAYFMAMRPALQNLWRAKAKSVLTMLGVVLGIAAVISTMSLARFAKDRIISSYEAIGVNNLSFSGWPNWRRSSRDFSPAVFRSFNWTQDIEPLLAIFTDVELVSPTMVTWSPTFNLGGLSQSEDKNTLIGVNDDFFKIANQEIQWGRSFSTVDVERANPVCVIGTKVADEISPYSQPIGKIMTIVSDTLNADLPCRVVGQLRLLPGDDDYLSPNYAVYIPYTYFQRAAGRPWDKEIRELRMKIRMGVDPDSIGEQISGYFVSRYGTSAVFNASSNAKTVDQMKLFLNVFSLLLTAVAVIALVVGGIGINNMMLVNLADRLNEIGLRKALGASAHQIRAMVLTESLVLSLIGGGFGLVGGFLVYHLLIYLGSHIVPNTQFAWVVDPLAIFAATATMIATGILSGLYPALKADRMQVIDALRRE